MDFRRDGLSGIGLGTQEKMTLLTLFSCMRKITPSTMDIRIRTIVK
jgi:hypothetical protein